MTSATLPSYPPATPFHLLQFLLRFAFHFQHRLRQNGFKMKAARTMRKVFFGEQKELDQRSKETLLLILMYIICCKSKCRGIQLKTSRRKCYYGEGRDTGLSSDL